MKFAALILAALTLTGCATTGSTAATDLLTDGMRNAHAEWTYRQWHQRAHTNHD